MKKILEVLQYGEFDIRFNTDIDVMKNPALAQDITIKSALAMTTSLWGGNEISVLAMIRALGIADLGVSVNRKEMVRYLDSASKMVEQSMWEARREFERKGGKIQVFSPLIKPTGNKSRYATGCRAYPSVWKGLSCAPIPHLPERNRVICFMP